MLAKCRVWMLAGFTLCGAIAVGCKKPPAPSAPARVADSGVRPPVTFAVTLDAGPPRTGSATPLAAPVPGGPGRLTDLPANTFASFDLDAKPPLKLAAIQQFRAIMATQSKAKAQFEALVVACGFDPIDRVGSVAMGALPVMAGDTELVPALVVRGTWTREEAKKCLTAMLTESNKLSDLPDAEGMGVMGVEDLSLESRIAADEASQALAEADRAEEQQAAIVIASLGNEDAATETPESLPTTAEQAEWSARLQEEKRHLRRFVYADGVIVMSWDGPLAGVIAAALKKSPTAETNAALAAAHSALEDGTVVAFTADLKTVQTVFPTQWSRALEDWKSNPSFAQFAPLVATLQSVSAGARVDRTGGMRASFVARTGSEADGKKAFEAVDAWWKTARSKAHEEMAKARPRMLAEFAEMESREPALKPQLASLRTFIASFDGLVDKIVVRQEGAAARLDLDLTAEEGNVVVAALVMIPLVYLRSADAALQRATTATAVEEPHAVTAVPAAP